MENGPRERRSAPGRPHAPASLWSLPSANDPSWDNPAAGEEHRNSLRSASPAHSRPLLDIDDSEPLFWPQPTDRKRRESSEDPYDLAQVTQLAAENAKLQAELDKLRGISTELEETKPWHVLHRINCPYAGSQRTFSDSPVVVWENGHNHFDCRRRVPSEKVWETLHSESPFVVYKDYECSDSEEDTSKVTPIPIREEVKILGRKLLANFERLLGSHAGLDAYRRADVLYNGGFEGPYDFYYHFGAEVKTFLSTCRVDQQSLKLLVTYLDDQTSSTLSAVRQRLADGIAGRTDLPYLFRPGDLIVSTLRSEPLVMSLSSPIKRVHGNWTCTAISVDFDGHFRLRGRELSFQISQKQNLIPIQSLPVYPLCYMDTLSRDALLARGKKFHSCCNRGYVTATTGVGDDERSFSEVRYMVDVQAFHILHPREKRASEDDVIDLQGNEDDLLIRLPAVVQGFRMLDKRWVTLRIDDISPVKWNTQAFEDLVISNEHDSDTKGLISALVQNKIAADQSIDFVEGKGTGLVLLLHGAPGTGKTLTAESVAEIGQKPLYRVTCGDIGTEPEQVEKYLESVFMLGRRWGCVVLLDEADVFLEKRSLDNLQRNALVSIFLRTMEYYDGILILTSNRVGHFDEAFKSRVQLAIPYKPLDGNQRCQVWKNFIRKLQDVGENMDVDDIRERVDVLANYDMNGRQIRNAINTARQLARFNNREPLKSAHLERALKVSQQFDRYIESVQHPGLSAEEMATESGDR